MGPGPVAGVQVATKYERVMASMPATLPLTLARQIREEWTPVETAVERVDMWEGLG